MTTCQRFGGHVNRLGYGRVVVNGKPMHAHRLAYIAAFGSIPAGHVVRHNCDNKACVNIDHLELGTQADNMDDRTARGRTMWGNGHPAHKLYMEDVRQIRCLLALGIMGSWIARTFSVSDGTVSLIKRNKTWVRPTV